MVRRVLGSRLFPRVLLLLSRTKASVPGPKAAELACSTAEAPLAYTLLEKHRESPDSWLLRFSLPPPRRWLAEDPALPTCLKVLFPNGSTEAGNPTVLEKSYSPVSHPATEGTVDLLVKGYAPRPGGGVGAYLCGLEVGESVHAIVKSKRVMHGSAAVVHRWTNVGLIAGGTGIAPLLQIARILLADQEGSVRVWLLSINRHEEDILVRSAIADLAAAHPDRFVVTHSLTAPTETWKGSTGRGDAALVARALPRPTGDGKTMVLVCGTDGFVASWGGPVVRGPKKADGSKGPKVQGPLEGLLAATGFDVSEVFKY